MILKLIPVDFEKAGRKSKATNIGDLTEYIAVPDDAARLTRLGYHIDQDGVIHGGDGEQPEKVLYLTTRGFNTSTFIEKNQPEGALDRLHTFVIKFVRIACEPHGIEVNRDKPLHSVFGEYVRALRDGGHLESAMAVRILKSSISVLEAFNDVRNNKSLAHDNPILNYEESLLIFNHVAASIRFIKALELKIKQKAEAAKKASWEDDEVPF